MTVRRFKRLKEGQRLSASDYNRMLAQIEILTNITGTTPIQVSNDGAGQHITFYGTGITGAIFLAKLTARAGHAYAWIEQEAGNGGVISDKLMGRTGGLAVNPAYEINGNVTVPIGKNVWLHPGYVHPTNGQEYLFDYCCDYTSGSGSGSGDGGGGVTCLCCDTAALPATVTLTLADIVACADLNGLVIGLTNDGNSCTWFGRSGIVCSPTRNILATLECTGNGPTNWKLTLEIEDVGGGNPGTIIDTGSSLCILDTDCVCVPLDLRFSITFHAGNFCCLGVGAIITD